MTDTCLAVIDATTGTVLDPSNLFAVRAPAETLDDLCSNDSDAHNYALKHGKHVREKLLSALLDGPSEDTVDVIASLFKWQVDQDSDGQFILYTDTYPKDKE